MREPGLDRHETWMSFWRSKKREVDEILVAWPSAMWWEREQMRSALGRLRFEIDCAERNITAPTYGAEPLEVPW